MIISRTALAVVRPAVADDHRQYANKINILPDGTVESTNGHIALRAKDVHPFPDSEFPSAGVPAFTNNPTTPTVVSTEIVDRFLKFLPKKKSTIPILDCVQLSAGASDAALPTIAATDLQMPISCTLDQSDANYPTIDRVMPAADRVEIKACIAVEVLQTLIAAAKAGGFTTITFGMPCDPYPKDGALVECFSLRFNNSRAGVELVGVAMPYRMP